MRIALLSLLLLASGLPLSAADPAKLTIVSEILGDSNGLVVTRFTFRFAIPSDVPSETPLVISGAASVNGTVVKRFSYPLDPARPGSMTAIIPLPAGSGEIEARLVVPLKEDAPVVIAKGSTTFTVTASGKPYTAGENAGAEAILAEGVVPDHSGAVRIVPPRRDIAPNLFVVDVETDPIVHRVEFWVEDKKILTRNAPPYRAELDLGKLPKRVEVRAVGYDDRNRYVDADAFIVNERELPLEAKITRTVTADGIAHLKVSVQNSKGTAIRSAVLFAGDRKLVSWDAPPYAFDIPVKRLSGVEYVRVSVVDETNYEAADLLFLNGDRFSESIEVNVVELPVTVSDASGTPIGDLQQADFKVLEDGKPKPISSFAFAAKLPITAGLLIDHSGSMVPRMEATKRAAAQFLRNIVKSGDRAFVAGFAFDATKLAPFASSIPALQEQVAAIPNAEGGTALYDAIVTGLYRFRGVTGRKALIVLTDGEDTTSRTSYEDMINYVRSAHVPLYFIGIGLGITDFSGTSKMKTLAAETGGVSFFIKDVKELEETYARLERDLRTQYLIAYETESSKKDSKYRSVEVKVARPGAVVRTIKGFIP